MLEAVGPDQHPVHRSLLPRPDRGHGHRYREPVPTAMERQAAPMSRAGWLLSFLAPFGGDPGCALDSDHPASGGGAAPAAERSAVAGICRRALCLERSILDVVRHAQALQ